MISVRLVIRFTWEWRRDERRRINSSELSPSVPRLSELVALWRLTRPALQLELD